MYSGGIGKCFLSVDVVACDTLLVRLRSVSRSEEYGLVYEVGAEVFLGTGFRAIRLSGVVN